MRRLRKHSRQLLYFWLLSTALGIVQPCCDAWAMPSGFGSSESASHHHHADNHGVADPASGATGHSSIFDCSPETHIGFAGGPLADARDSGPDHEPCLFAPELRFTATGHYANWPNDHAFRTEKVPIFRLTERLRI